MNNPTRKFYQLLNRNNKPSEEEILRTISIGDDFRSMTQTRAWKKIDAWIDTMDEGGTEYLHSEVRNSSAWGVVSIFNTFIKFLFVSAEMRAFRKLRAYIQTTIKRGEQENAKLQARKDSGKKDKSSS